MAPTPTKTRAKVPMNSATHCFASEGGIMDWEIYLFVVTFNLSGAPPVDPGRFVTTIDGRVIFVVRPRLLTVMDWRLVALRIIKFVLGRPGVGTAALMMGALVFFNSGCWASRSSMRRPASEAIPLNWLPLTNSS